MKKISITLTLNERMAVNKLKYTKGYLEYNYFWIGLLVKHRILPLSVDFDSITIKDGIADISYYPMNKSDLI